MSEAVVYKNYINLYNDILNKINKMKKVIVTGCSGFIGVHGSKN